jgi:2-haloalkanoic acid dehalogenase type II
VTKPLRLDRVRALSFDFYGTLFDDRNPQGDSPVAAMLRRLQADHPDLPLPDELLQRWTHFAALTRAPFLPWSRRRPILLRSVLAEVGDPPIEIEPYLHQVEAQFVRARPFDDALPALRSLRAAYPLAFVSNANARLLSASWSPHALPDSVALVTSEELGLYKPARGMFEAAAAALGVEPSAILHVGTDPHEDVEGALGAGFQAVWLNRDDVPRPGDVPAEVPALRSLVGLPPLLSMRRLSDNQ